MRRLYGYAVAVVNGNASNGLTNSFLFTFVSLKGGSREVLKRKYHPLPRPCLPTWVTLAGSGGIKKSAISVLTTLIKAARCSPDLFRIF